LAVDSGVAGKISISKAASQTFVKDEASVTLALDENWTK